MWYPSKVKTNMRHRGPVESYKMTRNKAETRADFARLVSIFTEHQTKLTAIGLLLKDGTTEIAGIRSQSLQITAVQRRIDIVKEGVEDV
jgi:hypothetical protein